MTNEEKLIEETAKYIAILRGLDKWDLLPIKQTKECGEACIEACYRQAHQIHELYKKYTYLKGDEKLPDSGLRTLRTDIIIMRDAEILRAGFKSTEEWR